MAKRVILFLLTNLAITFVLGIVLNIIFKVTGIQSQSTAGILVLSLVFGFSGSLISLFLSKTKQTNGCSTPFNANLNKLVFHCQILRFTTLLT